jgi:hypothetical protein
MLLAVIKATGTQSSRSSRRGVWGGCGLLLIGLFVIMKCCMKPAHPPNDTSIEGNKDVYATTVPTIPMAQAHPYVPAAATEEHVTQLELVGVSVV